MGKLNVQCFTCNHKEVCKYNEVYTKAIKAMEDISYGIGDNGVMRIRDTNWIDMELKCKYANFDVTF